MTFIGRTHELAALNRLYQAKGGKLVVIYGRRRIGKSALIDHFMKDKTHLRFEGLEQGNTKVQLSQFIYDLGEQTNDALLKQVKVDSWLPVLDYLTKIISTKKEKTVIFLDEFQWLSLGQSKLVSLIKKTWDQHWSKQNVMLILCGSGCSFMTKRVIDSKALYGRIDWELCLAPLTPHEAYTLLDKRRDRDEVLMYLLTFGGIPKYINEIDVRRSFDQNINAMLFIEGGFLVNDYQKVFYSQFKEYQTYEAIVQCLRVQPLTLEEIAGQLKMTSGGGMRSYLRNLEKASFVTGFTPYDKPPSSRLIKYKLTDPYLRFYFKYVEPHRKLIAANRTRNLFTELVKPHWQAWLGFAFENYCVTHAMQLARIMGFESQVVHFGPYFKRGDEGFQVDLIFLRSDRVMTMCEIKFYDKPVPIAVVHEVGRKCDLLNVPKGYTLEKALISRMGPEKHLRELEYFHHYVEVADFFEVQ
ncbi:MAG TPA: ATP-binding protein [Gammaproteobacteria bacterium]|nr:ATP-binding protein [Gammaproteobacteria bacterium]